MTLREAMLYEINASWWASYISSPRLQDLSARYFAWKTRRKYHRYMKNTVMIKSILEQLRP